MIRIAKTFDRGREDRGAEPVAERNAETGLRAVGDGGGELAPRQHLQHSLRLAAAELQRGRELTACSTSGMSRKARDPPGCRHRHPIHPVQRAAEVGRELVARERIDVVVGDRAAARSRRRRQTLLDRRAREAGDELRRHVRRIEESGRRLRSDRPDPPASLRDVRKRDCRDDIAAPDGGRPSTAPRIGRYDTADIRRTARPRLHR